MTPLVQHLHDHYWKNFCESLGVEINQGVFEDLHKFYSDPSRYYHGWSHIADCLRNLDRVRSITAFPILTECAILFHDVIYDTRRKDNEIRSAEFAVLSLTSMGVKDPFILKSVPLFIEASTHVYRHNPLTEINLFLDIDLASLGYSLRTFQQNTRDIRKEYDWVPTEQFVQERKQVLDTFAKRPSIYYTEFFRKKYEPMARFNLAQPILL